MALNRWMKWGGAVALLVALGVLLAWAFRMGKQGSQAEAEMERPVQAPLRVEADPEETLLDLDAADLSSTKIEAVPLEKAKRPASATAYGRVLDLTPLLDLQSRYASALAQEQQARTAWVTAQREYERMKDLHEKGGIVSRKQVEDAQAALLVSEAGVRAAETGRRALEDSIRQDWGEVLARGVTQGTAEFRRLAEKKELLVEVTLPPDARISSPPAAAAIRGSGGAPVRGRLLSRASRASGDLQGRAYFFVVPAAEEIGDGRAGLGLLPEMAVTASLSAGEEQQGWLVPDEAVVWRDGKPWVYVRKGPGKFARRAVVLDSPADRGWFVPEKTLPDLPVVVRGAQVLLSEESRAQIKPES